MAEAGKKENESLILFVCTGNTCRSPMAAALLREIIRLRGWREVVVESAGLAALPGAGLSRGAQEVLAERGLSQAHRARSLTGEIAEHAKIILTMTGEQKRRVFWLPEVEPKKVWTLGELNRRAGPRERLGGLLAIEPDPPALGEPEDISDPVGGTLEEYRRCLQKMEEILQGLQGRGK